MGSMTNELSIRWEVQTYTLCQGWTNTWLIDDQPEIFNSREDAEDALAEFLADIEEETACHWREPDEGYDPEDFRIAPVSSSAGA